VKPVANRRERAQQWVPVILLAGMAGYPLLGTLVVLSPLPSLVASIPMRLLVAVASILMIAMAQPARMSPLKTALWVFWLMYLARLVWDLFIVSVPGAGDALLLFASTCLLPAVALLRSTPRALDESAFAKLFLVLGFVTCLLAILITLANLSSGRSLFADTERLAFDTVNPITYGHVAATTVIAAISLLHHRVRVVWLVMLVPAVVAAAATLQLAASRGPAVSLAACLLVVAALHSRLRLIVLLVASLVILLVVSFGSALEDRITEVEDDPSTLERVVVQTNAISQFLDSPLTGSAYIETELEIYPHNPIIEAAMATGALGLALFSVVFVAVLARLIGLLRRGQIFVPLLALQYLIGSMVSGSLFASTQMWIVIVLVIAAPRPSAHAHRRIAMSRSHTSHATA